MTQLFQYALPEEKQKTLKLKDCKVISKFSRESMLSRHKKFNELGHDLLLGLWAKKSHPFQTLLQQKLVKNFSQVCNKWCHQCKEKNHSSSH